MKQLAWLVAFALVHGACTAQQHAGEAPSLFSPVPDATRTAAAAATRLPRELEVVTMQSATTLQQPAVMVMAADAKLLGAGPPAMMLQLPGVASSVRVEQRPELSFIASSAADTVSAASSQQMQPNTWVGEVAGLPGGLSAVILLHETRGVVYGSVRYWDDAASGFRAFRIAAVEQDATEASVPSPLQPGLVTIVEYKEPTEPRKGTIPRVHANRAHDSTADVAGASFEVPVQQQDSVADIQPQQSYGPAVHDLLVLYTPAALKVAGGKESAIKADVDISLSNANKAYADSDIPVTVRLVGLKKVNHVEVANASATLEFVRTDPKVKKLRDELGADMISMFTGLDRSVTKECGNAYVTGGMARGGADYAVSIIASGCWSGYTLAHEIGHIQGCHHNYDPQTYELLKKFLAGPYAWGYRRCGGATVFKTVMSYFCADDNRKSTEVGLFSNPAVMVLGYPSGDEETGNCARAITETARKVADYRPSKSNPSPSPQPRQRAKLALISSLPDGYKGPGGNLSAISNSASDSCRIPLSPVIRVDGVTLFSADGGMCNGDGLMDAGTYTLIQEPPARMSFQRWSCFDTTRGTPVPQQLKPKSAVNLTADRSYTCVAYYELDSSPSPPPRPSPSPSPRVRPSPSPRPSPRVSPSPKPPPKSSPSPPPSPSPEPPADRTSLSLFWQLIPDKPGTIKVILSATNKDIKGASCVKTSAPVFDFKSEQMRQLALCDSPVMEGLYQLQQNARYLQQAIFQEWRCWINTNDTVAGLQTHKLIGNDTVLVAKDTKVVCSAMYGIPDNPSPSPEFSPSPRPPGQSPTPPPSPAASRSMLALISDFYTKPSESGPADSYRGKSANLTATLLSDFTVKCSKAPSRIRGNNGTSLAAPEIWCTDNGEKKMPPGKYSLTYSEPPFVGFKQWRCDDFGDGNSAEPVLVDKADWSFTLKGNVRVVCVAEFTMD